MSIVRVAKYAGVSTATVSRVLNSVPVVSESTIRSVRAALEALKYDPMEVKRGPRPGTRRTTAKKCGMIAILTIGLHREKLRFPVTNLVVQAITTAAKQSGVRVLLDEMPSLAEVTSVVTNREVDGAVVFLTDEAPLSVLERLHQQLPIVWAMGGQAGPLLVDHISENNGAVGYLAHQYLYDRGCRDLAFLTLIPHKRNARQRGLAFASAAAESSIPCRSLVMSDNKFMIDLFGTSVIARDNVNDLVEAFVNMSPRPTGLFIDRDSTTARIYPILMRYGIQPGRDVTIVSCDNEEVALSALYPRPASIDLGANEIGYRAVRRLLLRIENHDEPPVLIQTMPQLCPGEELAALPKL